jgi:hypothetical protein
VGSGASFANPRIEDGLADITRRIWEQPPPQRVRGRAMQGLARPSRSALEHVAGAGRDRIAEATMSLQRNVEERGPHFADHNTQAGGRDPGLALGVRPRGTGVHELDLPL